jgi:hypothetical protein
MTEGLKMGRKMLKVAAGAAVLLSLGAGVASAATSPAAAPAWRSVGPSGVGGEVTAVTAVMYSGGKVAEFAFAFHGTKPSMYSRSGSGSWSFDTINVAKTGERIVSAKAIAPNEVVAATSAGRVLKRTGQTWTVLGTFGAKIGSASVLSASNVWVFGTSAKGGGNLGVWHFNGKAWTRVAKGYTNGSAQSSKNVWAASGTTLEHWNGARWTATSIAGFLSTRNATVSTIFTGGCGGCAPYAIVSENAKAAGGGGPIVVLEYNGHAWVRVATYASGSAVPGAAAADGAAGLWFAVAEVAGKPARLLHFGNAHHTLTVAALPGLTNDPAGSAISSIAQIGASARELAVGDAIGATGNPIAKIYYLS